MLSWWRRRQIRRAFSRYLTPKQVAKLAVNPEPPTRSLTTRQLYCLLSQVRDETVGDIQRNVAAALPIYLKHRGLIFDVISSFQLVAFGTHNFGGTEQECRQDSQSAASELLAVLAQNIKIVSFDGDMSIGLLGSESRFSYSIAAPRLDCCVLTLLETEFGRINEWGNPLVAAVSSFTPVANGLLQG